MEVTRPKDLVFTLFGEYLLDRDESVWVGSLISLLEPVGLSEGGVRTVLSRMTKKGWLSAVRAGRNSFDDLTPKGRQLLKEGQARIFHPLRNPDWDGRWFLLAYSIPQDSRHLRDRLRDRLAWLGFGSIGNGLWISPHDVAEEIEDLSKQMGLDDNLVCFRAERVGGEETENLVARCWNLEGLDVRYQAFVSRWVDVLDRLSDDPPQGPEQCFAQRFNLIHEFRGFPLEDPYLPRPLLPEKWAGDTAAKLFHAVHDALVGPADAYVDEVLSQAPSAALTKDNSAP
jgi:phenylacetic acid degradation operon negative regulatory protein